MRSAGQHEDPGQLRVNTDTPRRFHTIPNVALRCSCAAGKVLMPQAMLPLILLAVALTVPAWAQRQGEREIDRLIREGAEAEREIRRQDEAVRAEMATLRWQAFSRTAMLDGAVTHGAGVRSISAVDVGAGQPQRLRLDVRCEGSAASTVVIIHDLVFVGAGGSRVGWRVDNGPVQRTTWRASGDGRGIGLWQGSGVPFVRALMAGQSSLVVQFDNHYRRSVEVVFDLSNAADVLRPVADACRWGRGSR